MILLQILPPGSYFELLPWVPLVIDYNQKLNLSFLPQVSFDQCFITSVGKEIRKEIVTGKIRCCCDGPNLVFFMP